MDSICAPRPKPRRQVLGRISRNGFQARSAAIRVAWRENQRGGNGAPRGRANRRESFLREPAGGPEITIGGIGPAWSKTSMLHDQGLDRALVGLAFAPIPHHASTGERAAGGPKRFARLGQDEALPTPSLAVATIREEHRVHRTGTDRYDSLPCGRPRDPPGPSARCEGSSAAASIVGGRSRGSLQSGFAAGVLGPIDARSARQRRGRVDPGRRGAISPLGGGIQVLC